jgi:hypothetical protein
VRFADVLFDIVKAAGKVGLDVAGTSEVGRYGRLFGPFST